MPLEQVVQAIGAGHFLCLAGDEALLRKLPRGNWIAGTIPYFMGQDGGVASRAEIFVNPIEVLADAPQICSYDLATLANVCTDAPEHGYSLIILPAFSAVHSHYARCAPEFQDMFLKPILGWVAGVHLDDLEARTPLVVSGLSGEFESEKAVVMHVPLPRHHHARVDIVNLYAPGEGKTIRFPETGFSADHCWIDGLPTRLADHLDACGADLRRPLVANYSGAMINVSFKGVDAQTRRVDFYAPVFDDVEYRLAAPRQSESASHPLLDGVVPDFSCNCILNYLHDGLEGRKTGSFTGPMTFGEIAFLLLNQTLVYLTIEPETTL